MKILLHMGEPYAKDGPCAVRMRTLLNVFTQQGHQVQVLSPAPTGTAQEGFFACPTFQMKKKSSLARLLNSLSFGFSSFFISLKTGPADVVLTTSPPPLATPFAWLIAKIKGAKLVYDVRDIWPDVAWEMGRMRPEGLNSRVFAFIRNFMLRHAQLTLTVSPGKVEKLQGYAPKARIALIPNGLDEAFLQHKEDPALAEQLALKEGFTCVYTGNLGLAQGLQQMLELAKRAQADGLNARFLLFGRGADEEALKQQARELGLHNVFFHGSLPNAGIYTVLKNAGMCFVPLVNENLRDSVPSKLFEALGAGCPVLLAAVGDAADILKECGLGLSARPNDHEALYAAFTEIYRHREELLTHREETLQKVLQNYSRREAALQCERELMALLGKE